MISHNITLNMSDTMNNQKKISDMNKLELLGKCKEYGIKNCSSKNKPQLIELINNYISNELVPITNTNKNTIITSTELIKHENENENDQSFKFIDLFCGIGGFHQALTNIKGECVFACDINADCRKIYEQNYGLKPVGDITKIKIDEIPPFDVLCGGFPCQPFSKAGLQNGFKDDRGNLFFNICDIVKAHNPKYILLENVRNLASHDEGNTWKVIYENIDKLGYYTYSMPTILNALHFNIPQNRERVIIMCKRKDLGELTDLPIIPKNYKATLTKSIKDFICDDNNEDKYKIQGKLKDVEFVWNEFIQLLISHNIDVPKFPIWTDWWDNEIDEIKDEKEHLKAKLFYIKYQSWIDKNKSFFNDHKHILINWLTTSRKNTNWFGAVRKYEWQAGELKPDDSMNTVLWSCRGSGIRVKRCDYIPTLVAMAMTPIYGPKSRKLSPRELLRLQSFPDSFVFDEKKIYKQVGNSVNVTMIQCCADFLIFGAKLL